MRDIPMHYFWMSLLVMAGVTYLIRSVPFKLCRKKVENRFVKSFLAYVPYAVLGAMTFPAIIYSADKIAAGVAGSSAGGLTIALNALADRFIGPVSAGGLAMNPEVVHRIATICSGGLDSLPSNGTIINELTQAKLPHRVVYRPMGVCSVVIPLIVAVCLAVIAQFGIV